MEIAFILPINVAKVENGFPQMQNTTRIIPAVSIKLIVDSGIESVPILVDDHYRLSKNPRGNLGRVEP